MALAGGASFARFHATIFCVRVLRRRVVSRAARWSRRTNFSAAVAPPGMRARRVSARALSGASAFVFRRGGGTRVRRLLRLYFLRWWRDLEVGAAFCGEPIFAMVAEFDFRREHGAKGFADGRQVVAADPLA